jgi:uncharacterized protein (DUF305 family)
VITVFLRSLTTHWGGKLIAIIVSGYDGDGAEVMELTRQIIESQEKEIEQMKKILKRIVRHC